MGRPRLLRALCGGGGDRVATKARVRRRKQRPAVVSGGSKAAVVKSPGGGGGGGSGGCYVNGDGALVVEVAGGGGKKKDVVGRRVMVVADGKKKEAAGALQWALSQAVRSCDTVVLLAVVVKPVVAQQAVSDSCVNILGPKCSQHVEAMKSFCESTRPEVKVETCVVEAISAEERAPAVVEAARRHGASLLVLGQRRRLRVTRWLHALLWRRRRRERGGGKGSVVDYCIEHAPCVALGVRRRSSGGYLVSSKRHKDFWLLA